MNTNILKSMVENGLSTRKIAEELKTSQTNVRYWLKKEKLKTNPKLQSRRCGKCGETDPDKFYGHKKSICGNCHNQYNLEKGQEKRKKAVEHLGGKCKICGYNKHICSLDFHHRNPSEKDPSFKSMRYWSWKRIELEINKCDLLCKNCHAAVHAGLIKYGV